MSTIATFTLDDYDFMIRRGVFERRSSGDRRKARIELIEGKLRQMSPIGSRHEVIVDRLQEWSHEQPLKGKIWVRVQNSIGIPALHSAPEPDIAWVARRDYSDRRPQGTDVLLLIEVAESSLRYDRGRKARLYAKTGIADYWVVDCIGQTIEVFRQPRSARYSEQQLFSDDQVVQSLVFPRAKITPARLFARETYDG